MIKKVIVTGANGFIGKVLCKELHAIGVEVVAVVRNKTDVSELNGINGLSLVCCDMADIEFLPQLIDGRDIDAFFHLAWTGSSGNLRADYTLQLRNVEYSLNAVHVAAGMGIRRFVGAGTLVEKDVLIYHANDGATPNTTSIYGVAKIAAHFMTKAECTKLGTEHVWCYLPNTYGIGDKSANFVNMTCTKMLNGEKIAFTTGVQTYDFVYVTDTARAIIAVANKGKSNTAYYLGSAKPRPLREYIEIIRDNIDPSIELQLGEIPFNGVSLPESEYDISKLVADTGFSPEIDFEKGIKKTIDWMRTREGTD
ncbi:MAG: NAD(P)-dependent oxidoreductase [Muribaculum sp.]|nr:NAD(P)-dependent oxidoreductase [Muribaculum sp.]